MNRQNINDPSYSENVQPVTRCNSMHLQKGKIWVVLATFVTSGCHKRVVNLLDGVTYVHFTENQCKVCQSVPPDLPSNVAYVAMTAYLQWERLWEKREANMDPGGIEACDHNDWSPSFLVLHFWNYTVVTDDVVLLHVLNYSNIQ